MAEEGLKCMVSRDEGASLCISRRDGREEDKEEKEGGRVRSKVLVCA